jgi:hypothetical protein
MKRIDVDPHNWGTAQVDDIEAVLISTLSGFETGIGIAITVNIRVKHCPNGPITSYQRDSDGRTVIFLSAQDLYWCRYMYQFSHELCHIATNYDSPRRLHEFGWLEETICELASWTTLRTISTHWRVHPPFAHWKSYSSEIRKYRQKRIDSYKETADPRPLKQWFQSELSSLRMDSFQREKNAKIALAIMPFFYEHASGWKAAVKLNTWPVFPGTSVESFFADWMASAREEESVLQAILGKLI